MNEQTRDIVFGCASFVGMGIAILMAIMVVVWADRYFRWEHVHPKHSHSHEHPPHEHPHPIPEHFHPHTHDAEVGRSG